MAGAQDKTQKATPKRREEARRKGQVARSMDLNGSIVLIAGLAAIGILGPGVWERLRAAMHATLSLISSPDVVSGRGLGALFESSLETTILAVAPIAAVSMVAGVATSVGQVKWKPSAQILKPDPKRINPLNGAKNLFGPHALFEGGKSILKVAAVGGIAALAVFPKLPELAALVGMPAAALAPELARTLFDIAMRIAVAYLGIAVIDYVWQRYRHEKGLRMDHQEIKDEFKQQMLPPEVRSALRRRQTQAAKARMMDAVPQADVVVTNPTHYAVALAYDGSKPAPEVLAKGKDLVAAQIRRVAEEHGVPLVSDPPLARSLHAGVEVGHQIPEELFAAVAQVLAFVYRLAGRKVA